MSQVIIWTEPSGHVRISYLSPGVDAQHEVTRLTPLMPPGTVSRITDRASLHVPVSRRFRNTWRNVGPGVIAVDMPLARAQRMTEIREKRNRLLADSDPRLLQAQESNPAKVGEWRVYRQALRDLPQVVQPIVDTITSPEALEAFEPTVPLHPDKKEPIAQ